MATCKVCYRSFAEFGVQVGRGFVPVCRVCALKIKKLYERKYS